MTKIQVAVIPLRVLLVMLFVASVLGQTLAMPGQFAYMAQESPELAYLRWPMLTFSVLELLCVQVVIVSTWRLLTLVKADRIFSEGSLVWVDAIVWAIAAAWAMLLGVFVYFALTLGIEPGFPMLVMVMLVAGAAFTLLMVVLRALLRQATSLRTDMEAVI
jgi:hypothetical protein